MDLNEFSNLMEKRATVIPQRVAEIKKQVASAVLTRVVLDTPVDTSRAKSNWQVNLGSAAVGTIPAHEPGHAGSTAAASEQETIRQGQSVIAGAKAGVDIHITNNLPYIGLLNDGWSTQAPAGFVQSAAIDASHVVQNAKIIVS
jgi:hypothetical protein